jgi:hypothetical protein
MANITLEAVEAVMEQAKAEFPAAKQALLDTDGDLQAAVSLLTKEADPEACGCAETQSCCEDTDSEEAEAACENEAAGADSENCGCAEEASDTEAENCGEGAETEERDPKLVVEEIIEKVRAAIKAGNVDRILIRRNDEILVNIPVNLGLLGSAIALSAAPGALIAAAVAAYGFSCRIEIVRKDGSNEEL